MLVLWGRKWQDFVCSNWTRPTVLGEISMGISSVEGDIPASYVSLRVMYFLIKNCYIPASYVSLRVMYFLIKNGDIPASYVSLRVMYFLIKNGDIPASYVSLRVRPCFFRGSFFPPGGFTSWTFLDSL